MAIFGIAVLVAVAGSALAAPLITPYSPSTRITASPRRARSTLSGRTIWDGTSLPA
jgi:hypothetical protein